MVRSKSAVYIATNQGPVRIMRITEAPDLKLSVALVSLLSKKSSISDEYHDFVCLDTGVIAHHTLVDRYELQLDKDVDQGRGWKLGVFIGHQLFHQQNLATGDEREDDTGCGCVILASGDIDSGSHVRPIKDVATKLRSAEPVIRKAYEDQKSVMFYLPDQSFSSEDEELIQIFRERYSNLNIASLCHLEFDNPLPHCVVREPEHAPISSTFNPLRPRSLLGRIKIKTNPLLKRRMFWWSAIIALPCLAVAILSPDEVDLPAPADRPAPHTQISAFR